MRVREIWRYPVKSLHGERVDAVDITDQGVHGDRRFAIFDRSTGLGLTGRRFPQLLFASATFTDDGGVRITLPDGSAAADDRGLSTWLGRPVELRGTAETDRRYENPGDFEHDSEWQLFSGAPGAFHDSARARVSLLSSATIGRWAPQRFRANLLLDGAGEDDLVGHQLAVGAARLDVIKPIDRCVMVTRPQPGGIERDIEVLRTIHRERKGYLAVGATVVTAGQVSLGDALVVT